MQVDSMIKPWTRVASVSKPGRQRRYFRKWWEWRLMCRELNMCCGVTNRNPVAVQRRFRPKGGGGEQKRRSTSGIICSKRMVVSVKERVSINGQALKLRWMKFGCFLLAVQDHDEGKLPDNNACHSPQCTEFCELVCYLKFTNIPVAAILNSPRQTRSLLMFSKLEGD